MKCALRNSQPARKRPQVARTETAVFPDTVPSGDRVAVDGE
jgi:hypothetical protein